MLADVELEAALLHAAAASCAAAWRGLRASPPHDLPCSLPALRPALSPPPRRAARARAANGAAAAECRPNCALPRAAHHWALEELAWDPHTVRTRSSFLTLARRRPNESGTLHRVVLCSSCCGRACAR
jgi:hypothetical protein